jgi:hypothetical protein
MQQEQCIADDDDVYNVPQIAVAHHRCIAQRTSDHSCEKFSFHLQLWRMIFEGDWRDTTHFVAMCKSVGQASILHTFDSLALLFNTAFLKSIYTDLRSSEFVEF